MPTQTFEPYNIEGESVLQTQRNVAVKRSYGSFPQQYHLKGNTKFFFSWAVSGKILQTGTVLLRTTAQRHKLRQPCAVSKEFVFGRGNHSCQKHHTFSAVSWTFLLGSLCSGAANRFLHRCLPSVCWQTKPDAE